MGLLTTLKAVSIGPTQASAGAIVAGDPASTTELCIVRTGELINAINSIVTALPGGDPNISPLNTLVTSLS